jgi:hypothetical protein
MYLTPLEDENNFEDGLRNQIERGKITSPGSEKAYGAWATTTKK